MKITLDAGAVMPTYAHDYDAGIDLYAKSNGKPVLIPPLHFCGLVKSRSGLLMKGIQTDGLVDADYTGSIRIILFNHGECSYTVHPGDKIAQMVVSPCLRPPVELVEHLEHTQRGDNGFGSTGR